MSLLLVVFQRAAFIFELDDYVVWAAHGRDGGSTEPAPLARSRLRRRKLSSPSPGPSPSRRAEEEELAEPALPKPARSATAPAPAESRRMLAQARLYAAVRGCSWLRVPKRARMHNIAS